MRNDTTTLLLAAGLGAISGIRSLSAVALLSLNEDSNGRASGRLTSLLRSKPAGAITSALAAGEMAADKAADLPPRTDLSSLIGRAGFGALAGAIVAESRSGNLATAALVGAVSAIGSAHLFYYMRNFVTERSAIPDWAVGLAEDLLVLRGGKRIVEAR